MRHLMLALSALCLLAPLTAQAQATAFQKNVTQDDGTVVQKSQAVSAATPLPVGKATLAGATFNTPSGTTAYASGDLIANSGTAGSVVPMAFTVCRENGTTGIVRRARIKTVDTGFASATVRLHLYKSSPTSAVGDNGVYSTTESDWIGDIDVILDHVFTDPFEKGVGVPLTGSEISYDCNGTVQTIYGLLEARGAYTPQGAKAWTVVLEAWPN